MSFNSDKARGRMYSPWSYRSFLTFTADHDSLDRILDQLTQWLEGKRNWNPDLSVAGFQRNGDSDLSVVHHATDSARNFRARLVEPSTFGAWRTELAVHVPERGDGWLLLDIANDQGRWVKAPRLARGLIETLDVHDGGTLGMATGPVLVSADEAQDLADVVCDPDRHGLVLVAGSDHQLPLDRFTDQVRRWSEQVIGQAAVAVLDPAATAEFAAIMGTSHSAAPWTLRTYRPDTDPAQTGDALRHRFLTTARLGRAPDSETRMLLGRVARQHAATRTLPDHVTSLINVLIRTENGYLTDALTSAGPPPHGASADTTTASPTSPPSDDAAEELPEQATSEHIRRLLGLQSLDDSSLRQLAERAATAVDTAALARIHEQLENQQRIIGRLQADLQSTRNELEYAELAHALTAQDLSAAEDRARWLASRLKEHQDYEAAVGPVPAEEATEHPEDINDLLDRLCELEPDGVIFTGDRKPAAALLEIDPWRRITRTTWDILLVLVDYIKARTNGDCDGGVASYLDRTPPGYRTMSARRHAFGETGRTVRDFGEERIFPVPLDVSPDGKALMTAHWKLDKVGMVSPRMYYLDHTTKSGRIIIGYIGQHLTNTQTR